MNIINRIKTWWAQWHTEHLGLDPLFKKERAYVQFRIEEGKAPTICLVVGQSDYFFEDNGKRPPEYKEGVLIKTYTGWGRSLVERDPNATKF